MALQKQPVAINFAQGLNTKVDPFQVSPGQFLALSNSIFTKQGALTKRNGFRNITSLPDAVQTTLTTLNDNLIATGSNLYAYSQTTNQWLNQGIVQPIRLDTQSLIRVSTSQTSQDTVVSPDGLILLTYRDNGASYYQITDSVTGQQIVNRHLLPSAANYARVFILGRYFIITFISTVAATPTLQYIAIPYMTPSNPGPATTISNTLLNASAGYDAYVYANTMYVAYGEAATIGIRRMSQTLVQSGVIHQAGSSATLMSVVVDPSNNNVWVVSYDENTDDGFAAAYSPILANLVTPTQIINNIEVSEITSISPSGILNVFYEVINNYSYTDAAGDDIRTDYINKLTVTPPVGVGAGVVGPTTVMLRSVGLSSKAFVGDDSTIYMMVSYGDNNQTNSLDDTNQPTYFLVNSNGQVYMRLAYSNGGGYQIDQVLPSISIYNDSFYFPYLITDFLTTVNKGTNLPEGTPLNAIYTQTGVNMAKFSLPVTGQQSSEIAGALHLTGGQLWEYDGVRSVEHGFHVWPENIAASGISGGGLTPQTYEYVFTYEWTDNAGMLHRSAPSIPFKAIIVAAPTDFTADTTDTDPVLTNVSSFTGLQVGQTITGAGIPADTTIIALDPDMMTITMSNDATITDTTVTITPASLGTAILNVPTLRLTYKLTPNPVRIVGYRWSTAQQIYYQFTSVTSPVVNNTAVDSVEITDDNSDAEILGQTPLYTNGGVLENIAAPASIDSALFSNRLFLIDAEDQNLLWFSKQVIQSVPVEMSDLLTIYIAPTTGAQGSTGPMTALGAMDDKLIVFKRDAIYYINGSGPDNTGANNNFSDPVFITATVGSDNPNSVVLTPNGTMFQSDKGIWMLGRDLQTTYIGAAVEQYNNNRVVSAEAIPATNEVRFILDNNVTLMYDYFYGQWSTHTNKYAISGTLYQSMHTYLNSFGQVFQEVPGTYVDGATPVLMSLTTSWMNIAGLQGYERFYFANLLGTYYSPFKLNFQLAYDYNSSNTQAVIVTPDNYSPPYGGEAVWGSGGPWGGPGNVFSARVFPTKQKCQSFQVTINEVYDASLGVAPGQGLSLSGLALVVGMKKGYRTQKASRSFG